MLLQNYKWLSNVLWGRRGRDRMVVLIEFTTTYAISAYHNLDQGEVYNIMW